MSRIGRCPSRFPPASTSPSTAATVTVKGPKGELCAHRRRADRRSPRRGRPAQVTRPNDERRVKRSLHGLSRTLVANMVTGVTEGYTQDARDRRRRLPRRGQGHEPRVRARLQPPGAGRRPRRHHLHGRDARPSSASRASTSSRSARSPPTSASCASPTRTRARACGTRARSSAARSERLVSKPWPSLLKRRARATGKRGRRASARHIRVRKKVTGTAARPRLVVTRSPRHIVRPGRRRHRGPHAGVGVDPGGRPAAPRATRAPRPARSASCVAERAKAAGIDTVVFDRGGNRYARPGRRARRRRPRGRTGVLSAESRDARYRTERGTADGRTPAPRRRRRWQRAGRRRPPRRRSPCASRRPPYLERVVTINRVAKVVKGGRRFSFTALVVVGDGDGTVGVGYGKAKEVPAAIAKGVEEAKKNFFRVPRIAGTIPHPVQGEAAAGVVLLRPAAARYRCHRRWPGARRAGVRRHPRRAVQVARLGQPDQHRARDRRRPEAAGAAGGGRRPPWPADRGRRPGGDAAGPGRTGGLTWLLS